MLPFQIVVADGRLVLDVPSPAPDGTDVVLVPCVCTDDWVHLVDEYMSEEETRALHQALRESMEDAEAGRVVDADEVIQELSAEDAFLLESEREDGEAPPISRVEEADARETVGHCVAVHGGRLRLDRATTLAEGREVFLLPFVRTDTSPYGAFGSLHPDERSALDRAIAQGLAHIESREPKHS